ncbi:SCP2 sterol-binding domain-containing protein [Actinomadura macrotermitis]|uniref:SCP2 domain-containing protein n=1 Tax=Actinomadura macrotermitis TaxID=2585200 RepID=A0A7K0BUV5_9ACTN|nr:SCP2 sterol-binding domain-containing protein [Actinomadura macrotermitis]MQY04969.1 hypothetical protein [Actinomadura macrotermitis]
MTDPTVLRETDDLPTLLAHLKGVDMTSLLEQADPADLRRLTTSISTPGELRDLLALAGDDATITAFIAKGGVEAMLDQVFGLMPTRLLPEKIGADGGTVEWHIGTPDGEKTYHLTIADGTATGTRGAADRARTTLTMSAPDLLRLCAGTLDGVAAFMTQKIKLSGDMLFGAKLASAFDTTA